MLSIVGFENNNHTGATDRTLIEAVDREELIRQLRAVAHQAHVTISGKVIDFLLGRRPVRCYAPGGMLMVDGLGDVYACAAPPRPSEASRESPGRRSTRGRKRRGSGTGGMQADGCERSDAAVDGFQFLRAALGRT